MFYGFGMIWLLKRNPPSACPKETRHLRSFIFPHKGTLPPFSCGAASATRPVLRFFDPPWFSNVYSGHVSKLFQKIIIHLLELQTAMATTTTTTTPHPSSPNPPATWTFFKRAWKSLKSPKMSLPCRKAMQSVYLPMWG